MGADDTFQGDRDSEARLVVHEVAIIAYDDCQLSAVYGLSDVFRVAGEQLRVLQPGASEVVRVSHWVTSPSGPRCSFDTHPGEPHRVGTIIYPPSLLVPREMQDARQIHRWVRARHDEGATVAAVCAGVFLLAATGILHGRDATTHWAFADEFERRHPEIRLDMARMIIDDGDVITGGGILAWVDLGLTIVQRVFGASVMLRTSRFMLADPPRRAQQPYADRVTIREHTDGEVHRAQDHIRSAASLQLPIGELAEVVGLHPRTLQRRFKLATGMTITNYLQHERMTRAQESLELTERSFEQIAAQLGYEDVSTFRRLFRRTTGMTPLQYRRRFGVR